MGSLDQKRRKLRGVTAQMKEVSLEQKRIREGQRQVQEKLEAIEAECDELRKEAALISQQSAGNQNRLALIFQILKARENRDFTKAAEFAQALRELVVNQKA